MQHILRIKSKFAGTSGAFPDHMMEAKMGIIRDDFCSKHWSKDPHLMNFSSDHHLCIGPASPGASACSVRCVFSYPMCCCLHFLIMRSRGDPRVFVCLLVLQLFFSYFSDTVQAQL